ncbi:MAG: iron uptake porin, partial [Synechococcus sp.]
VTEVTDELKRLMREFDRELAMLKGRVNGLEARVGEMEASFFSTTTKLSGRADFVIGATGYGGDQTDNLYDANSNYLGDDGLSFSYRYTLNLNTSFTGKDLLYTRLRSGNFNTNAFSGKGYTGSQTQLNSSNSNNNILKIDKIWYEFPVGDFRVFVGPEIENYYMLAAAPGIYKPMLKQFKLGGYYGAYGASTSPGFGVNWISDRFANYGDPKLKLSVNYAANNGDKSNARSGGGLFTDSSKGKFLSQVAYGNSQWQVSAAYAYSQRGMTVGGAGTPLGASKSNFEEANQFNLNAYWQPSQSGWVPSISVGWSLSTFNLPQETIKGQFDGVRTESQSWLVGLNWKDAFLKGNRLGFAFGSPQFVTAINGEATKSDGTTTMYPDDGNMAFELYYDFQVTDNITVTPAVFYLSRPFGQLTGSSAETGGLGADQFNTLGALVQTSFKF